MVAVILMWSPPSGLGGLWLALWVAGGLLLYETAQDVFLIPHGALGVEPSQSYHERTRVFAWQHLFLALGTLCGLGAFALIEDADARARVRVFALAIFLRFRFNQREHAEIRRELDARNATPRPS